MILNIVNVISITCALVMVWATISLYELTRSRSLLVLLGALAYLTFVRILVSVTEAFIGECWITQHTSYLIAPFWPTIAIGFVLLYLSLRGMYVVPKTTPYVGPDRRSK